MDEQQIERAVQQFGELGVLRAVVSMYSAILNDDGKRKSKGEPLPMIQKPAAQNSEPVVSHDSAPCGSCGGTFFLRTGTCHVCQTCGTSQGCS